MVLASKCGVLCWPVRGVEKLSEVVKNKRNVDCLHCGRSPTEALFGATQGAMFICEIEVLRSLKSE